MASQTDDIMQWAPSPVHHFDRLPAIELDFGAHRNSNSSSSSSSSHMQSNSSFASTGFQHPPIPTASSGGGGGGGGCPYAQSALRLPRSQAAPLGTSSSNTAQQQNPSLDFLCRPSSLYGGNSRNPSLPDPLGLSYSPFGATTNNTSSHNNSSTNTSRSTNTPPYDPVHHSQLPPTRSTQNQQQQQQQPHYDPTTYPTHSTAFPWALRSSLPPHPRSRNTSGDFCPPGQLLPPPPLTPDQWVTGGPGPGRGNPLGHRHNHMLHHPSHSYYLSMSNQSPFWHQQGSQPQRNIQFSPPSVSSRPSLLPLASLPPLAPRNMASASSALGNTTTTTTDSTTPVPHIFASPVSSPSPSTSSIATSPPLRDLRSLRPVPRDQTQEGHTQGRGQQSQSAARETSTDLTAPSLQGSSETTSSSQRRAQAESNASSSGPNMDYSHGLTMDVDEHMSDDDRDESDDDSNDSHIQDMYVQQLGANAAIAQTNRDLGRREELEARREERIRQQQLLRGAMTNKRIASRTAVSSMETVDIASLPESERTCVICYNDFGVPSPEGISEAALRLPKCKHVFGDHCIKKWLQDSDTCPYCRDKLPSESVVSVNHRSLNTYLEVTSSGSADPPWFQRATLLTSRRAPLPDEETEFRHRRRSRHAAPTNYRRGQATSSANMGEPAMNGSHSEIPRLNSLASPSDPLSSQRTVMDFHSVYGNSQETWHRFHYNHARHPNSSAATGAQHPASQRTEAGSSISPSDVGASSSGISSATAMTARGNMSPSGPTADEGYLGAGAPFSQQLPPLPRLGLDNRGLVGTSSTGPDYQYWNVQGPR